MQEADAGGGNHFLTAPGDVPPPLPGSHYSAKILLKSRHIVPRGPLSCFTVRRRCRVASDDLGANDLPKTPI